MADYFVAISEDGIRFKLNNDGTWEPDVVHEVGKERFCFRSSNWGDSIAEVKAAEKVAPMNETDDWLLYQTQIAGFPVFLSFRFVNGMLLGGLYNFQQKHSEYNDFFSDFESLINLLTLKYGEEKEFKDYWSNELYRGDHQERGRAIAVGHHAICVTWGDNETDISLQITGKSNEISLVLLYKSTRLQALADADSESQKLVGL